MKKTLSSSMTFFWKFIFPSIWIVGFGTGTISLLFSDTNIKWEFLGAWIFGITILYISLVRTKKVAVDDEFLYISNFFKSIKVPISNILKTTDVILISPRIVIIHFKEKTVFGKSIHFIASILFLGVFKEHPVIKEIEDKITSANKAN